MARGFTGLCSQPQGPGLGFPIALSPAKVVRIVGIRGPARWRPGPVIANLEGSDIQGRDSGPLSASSPPSSLDLTEDPTWRALREIGGAHSDSLSNSCAQHTGVGIRLSYSPKPFARQT